jgi:hypothetical protein
MFIAQRRVSILGIFRFWAHDVADWRFRESDALQDIEREIDLRRPITPPVLYRG